MYIGLLTTPFREEPLDRIIAWAGANGFSGLEINCTPGGQLDPGDVEADAGDHLKAVLAEQPGLRISSLAVYMNVVDPDPDTRRQVLARVKAGIRAAQLLGVEAVCTLAGMPMPGKSKMKTIEEDCAGVFAELCEYAGERGIKLCLENWYQTNIQHLEHWRKLFDVAPYANFGLNFDPSHLFWQQIDPIEAVYEFAPRIFHTHAKDCEIRPERRAVIGVLEHGWWRYVIPGLGAIHWGRYINALRDIQYEGVLSIEHEDRACGREEGFLLARKHLDACIQREVPFLP
jgi:sugar phosphate isomerase/epimerase